MISPGNVAYDAYCNALAPLDFPHWESLSPEIKAAWEAAAAAVRS